MKFSIPKLEVVSVWPMFLNTDFLCKCGRVFNRTLELPNDAQGRPARLPYPDEFKFSCVECNRGKCSPRKDLTPETYEAVLKFVKAAQTARERVDIEEIAWKLHVKEDAVIEAIRDWKKALNAEDTDD